MQFSPSTNVTANRIQRMEAMRQVLCEEGMEVTPHYSAITRLFGYENAVSDETFTGVVVECAKQGRLDLVDRFLDFLPNIEIGRLGLILVQQGLSAALVPLLPRLQPYQVSPFVGGCIASNVDRAKVFAVVRPFLQPSMASIDLLCRAGAANAEEYGQYLVEHAHVLDALRTIKTPLVAQRIAGWWATAIAENRIPVPDLGRSARHWCKKFPELSAVMRSQALDASLAPASPSVNRLRF